MSEVTHLISQIEFEPSGISSTYLTITPNSIFKDKEGIMSFLEQKRQQKFFLGIQVFLLLESVCLCLLHLYVPLFFISLCSFSPLSSLLLSHLFLWIIDFLSSPPNRNMLTFYSIMGSYIWGKAPK